MGCRSSVANGELASTSIASSSPGWRQWNFPMAPMLSGLWFQTNYPSGLPNTTSVFPLSASPYLFGGSSAMQTANPFATSALFGDNGGGNDNFLGSFANYPASGHDSIFGQDDGAALLDSSLLTSLWMDESASRKTKNPFAT
jgi:hypothetical protein